MNTIEGNPPTAETSVTGLPRCPFCGSVVLTMLTYRDEEALKPTFHMLQCNFCGSTGPAGNTEAAARVGWSTRALQA